MQGSLGTVSLDIRTLGFYFLLFEIFSLSYFTFSKSNILLNSDFRVFKYLVKSEPK